MGSFNAVSCLATVALPDLKIYHNQDKKYYQKKTKYEKDKEIKSLKPI